MDDSNLTLHDSGDTWADVTEGNKLGWERERYEWDAEAGTISAVTTDSNLWGPGSRWDYTAHPAGRRAPWSRSGWNGTPRDAGRIWSARWCRIGGKRMITTSFGQGARRVA